MKKYVYFRNDDVNTLDKELIEITELFLVEQVPIIHAIEPVNVKDETVKWLFEVKKNNPHLIEIMQHGFDHKKRDKGEFGGKRSYHEQFRDLSLGKSIMQDKFGIYFLNAINFPFGPYNRDTIRAIKDLEFDIISSHFNYRLSRRIFYTFGNVLGKGQMFGKHISHHMRHYPGTNILEIDICLSLIKEYIGGYGSHECVFEENDVMVREYQKFAKYTDVIGILLHHRYHREQKSLKLIEGMIKKLKGENEVTFTNYSNLFNIYKRK